jgi:hypothetical protein
MFVSSICQSFGSTQHPPAAICTSWHFFEPDKRKATALIAKAERALVLRERELFAHPQNADREAVNIVLHSLEALKTWQALNASAIAA